MKSAFLARLAGEEMLSRLDWMTLQPDVVLDIGCGVGEMSRLLQNRYPTAHVMAVDHSLEMLAYGQDSQGDGAYLCSDANRLPFKDSSVQLIFANFLLPWVSDVPQLLHECKRVLSPEGLLMINALGPDTLRGHEAVLASDSVPQRIDMHDLGDLLLKIGFLDPVLDVNTYAATYQDPQRFYEELQASGFYQPSESSIVNVQEDSSKNNHEWYTEVIFAHAFAPGALSEASLTAGEASIPLAWLRRQRHPSG